MIKMNEVLDKKVKLSNTLLKARTEGKKKQLDVSWIDQELNGYLDDVDDDNIPKYREMAYECEVHGAGLQNQYGIIHVSGLPRGDVLMRSSIKELELCGEYYSFRIDPKIEKDILDNLNTGPFAKADKVVMKPTSNIAEVVILDVRHRLIDWLEEHDLLESEENITDEEIIIDKEIRPLAPVIFNIQEANNTNTNTNSNTNDNTNNITVITQIENWTKKNPRKFWLIVLLGGFLVFNSAASNLSSNLQYYPTVIKNYIQD